MIRYEVRLRTDPLFLRGMSSARSEAHEHARKLARFRGATHARSRALLDCSKVTTTFLDPKKFRVKNKHTLVSNLPSFSANETVVLSSSALELS